MGAEGVYWSYILASDFLSLPVRDQSARLYSDDREAVVAYHRLESDIPMSKGYAESSMSKR